MTSPTKEQEQDVTRVVGLSHPGLSGLPQPAIEADSMKSQIPSPACDAVLAGDHPAWESGGPCATCAFRPGTEAATTQHTVELARLCVEGFRYFGCHEHAGLCRGYVAAMNLRGVPQDEDDRRWSIVAGEAADILQMAIEAGIAADAVDQKFTE